MIFMRRKIMNKLRKNFFFPILCVIFLIVGFAMHAYAGPIITFDQLVDGGSLSYDGLGGALVGTNIRFDRVQGIDTPLNDGVLLTMDAYLDFQTGLLSTILYDSIYIWEGGGSFTVTGNIYEGTTLVASGTLLQGTWNEPVLGSLGIGYLSVQGTGLDSKNTSLLTYYGMQDDDDFIFANTDITANYNFNGSAFTASIVEADIANMPASPEPATMLLFGTGLIGLAGFGKKKFLKKV